MYGNASVIRATAASGDPPSLNSVESLYLLMSQSETIPASNVRPGVIGLARERATSLAATLARITADLASAHETEGRALIEPTLLRLQLLDAQTP